MIYPAPVVSPARLNISAGSGTFYASQQGNTTVPITAGPGIVPAGFAHGGSTSPDSCAAITVTPSTSSTDGYGTFTVSITNPQAIQPNYAFCDVGTSGATADPNSGSQDLWFVEVLLTANAPQAVCGSFDDSSPSINFYNAGQSCAYSESYASQNAEVDITYTSSDTTIATVSPASFSSVGNATANFTITAGAARGTATVTIQVNVGGVPYETKVFTVYC